MKVSILLKHVAVVVLALVGGVFLALGASSLDVPIFAVLFLGLGLGLVYLAVKLNRLEDELTSQVRQLYQHRRTEMAVTLALAVVAISAADTIFGWLLLWPFWGVQPLVYIASAFLERAISMDLGFVFKGLALAFEGVYLYFISSSAVGIIRTIFSRSNKPL